MKHASWDFCEKPSRCGPRTEVNQTEPFDARGMRLVYGREDHYGRGRTFHMDVWLTRRGRLLARFWSRSSEVDEMSLEVIGFSPRLHPRKKGDAFDARWVPQRLREAYDDWIDEES